MNPITTPPAHIARTPVLSADDAERNKKAREDAEAVIQLCGEQPRRFWETLAELAEKKYCAAPAADDDTEKAFNHFQAMSFEKQSIQYGTHAGETIGSIPTEYLAWLAEGDDFVKDVRRYVKSARFKERQRNE